MTRATLEYDLSLARNKNGEPLSETTKELIFRLFSEPTALNWDKCCAIVLAPSRGGSPVISLWQAVYMVDSTFPIKVDRHEDGTRRWPRIPSRTLIEQAIKLATH
jgi:hypothetical protein